MTLAHTNFYRVSSSARVDMAIIQIRPHESTPRTSSACVYHSATVLPSLEHNLKVAAKRSGCLLGLNPKQFGSGDRHALRASASELAFVEQRCCGAMFTLSLHRHATRHSALPPASRIELQCIFLETLLGMRVIGFRGDHVPLALICELAPNCTAYCLEFSPNTEEP
jgi:hypothetical protein